MNVFILEDNSERIKVFRKYHPNATICIDVEDAKKRIHEKKYDMVFLDHDLGGEIYADSEKENTGYQFAKYIKEKVDMSGMSIVVHSFNQAGAKNMLNVLKQAVWIPFSELFKK